MTSPSAVAYHETLAAHWEQRYEHGGFKRRAKFIAQEMLPGLPLAGARWLDAGCGTGLFARMLARGGASVTGIDGAREMIAAGAAQAQREGLSACLDLRLVDELERLDFADATFDGCICFSVVEYLDAPARALVEIARVLKPGGYFVASFPNVCSAVRRAQSLMRVGRSEVAAYLAVSRNSWTREGLATTLQRSGFRIVRHRGFDPLLPNGLHGLLPPSLHFVIARKPEVAAEGPSA